MAVNLHLFAFLAFHLLVILSHAQVSKPEAPINSTGSCNFVLLNSLRLAGNSNPSIKNPMLSCNIEAEDNCCSEIDEIKIIKSWTGYTQPRIFNFVAKTIQSYTTLFQSVPYLAALDSNLIGYHYEKTEWVKAEEKKCMNGVYFYHNIQYDIIKGYDNLGRKIQKMVKERLIDNMLQTNPELVTRKILEKTFDLAYVQDRTGNNMVMTDGIINNENYIKNFAETFIKNIMVFEGKGVDLSNKPTSKDPITYIESSFRLSGLIKDALNTNEENYGIKLMQLRVAKHHVIAITASLNKNLENSLTKAMNENKITINVNGLLKDIVNGIQKSSQLKNYVGEILQLSQIDTPDASYKNSESFLYKIIVDSTLKSQNLLNTAPYTALNTVLEALNQKKFKLETMLKNQICKIQVVSLAFLQLEDLMKSFYKTTMPVPKETVFIEVANRLFDSTFAENFVATSPLCNMEKDVPSLIAGAVKEYASKASFPIEYVSPNADAQKIKDISILNNFGQRLTKFPEDSGLNKKVCVAYSKNNLVREMVFSVAKFNHCNSVISNFKVDFMKGIQTDLKQIENSLLEILNLKKGVYCAVCSKDKSSFFDIDKNSVFLSNKFCIDFLAKHKDYFKWRSEKWTKIMSSIHQYVSCFSTPNSEKQAFPFSDIEQLVPKLIPGFKNCLKVKDESQIALCDKFCSKFSIGKFSKIIDGDLKQIQAMSQKIVDVLRMNGLRFGQNSVALTDLKELPSTMSFVIPANNLTKLKGINADGNKESIVTSQVVQGSSGSLGSSASSERVVGSKIESKPSSVLFQASVSAVSKSEKSTSVTPQATTESKSATTNKSTTTNPSTSESQSTKTDSNSNKELSFGTPGDTSKPKKTISSGTSVFDKGTTDKLKSSEEPKKSESEKKSKSASPGSSDKLESKPTSEKSKLPNSSDKLTSIIISDKSISSNSTSSNNKTESANTSDKSKSTSSNDKSGSPSSSDKSTYTIISDKSTSSKSTSSSDKTKTADKSDKPESSNSGNSSPSKSATEKSLFESSSSSKEKQSKNSNTSKPKRRAFLIEKNYSNKKKQNFKLKKISKKVKPTKMNKTIQEQKMLKQIEEDFKKLKNISKNVENKKKSASNQRFDSQKNKERELRSHETNLVNFLEKQLGKIHPKKLDQKYFKHPNYHKMDKLQKIKKMRNLIHELLAEKPAQDLTLDKRSEKKADKTGENSNGVYRNKLLDRMLTVIKDYESKKNQTKKPVRRYQITKSNNSGRRLNKELIIDSLYDEIYGKKNESKKRTLNRYRILSSKNMRKLQKTDTSSTPASVAPTTPTDPKANTSPSNKTKSNGKKTEVPIQIPPQTFTGPATAKLYLYLLKTVPKIKDYTRVDQANHDEVLGAKPSYVSLSKPPILREFKTGLKPIGIDLTILSEAAKFTEGMLRKIVNASPGKTGEVLHKIAIKDVVVIDSDDISSFESDLKLEIKEVAVKLLKGPSGTNTNERQFAIYNKKKPIVADPNSIKTRKLKKIKIVKRKTDRRKLKSKNKKSGNTIMNFLMKLLF